MASNPFVALRSAMKDMRLPAGCAPVPFAGGAIGMLGYELGGWLERVACRHPRRDRAERRADELLGLLAGAASTERTGGLPRLAWRPELSQAAHRAVVGRALC